VTDDRTDPAGPGGYGGNAVHRQAVVISGTGMLTPCAVMLVEEGWHVVLPSRRHAPIPVVSGTRPAGRALWVAASPSDPAGMVDGVRRVLHGPVELLVAWVHSDHRADVLHAVAPLLARNAPVVEVHGSAAADAKRGLRDPVLADHPTQQVVLGFVPVGHTSRRPTHDEISDAVATVVTRALAGRPPSVQQIGRPRRWSCQG
jgi:hypothetical protein